MIWHSALHIHLPHEDLHSEATELLRDENARLYQLRVTDGAKTVMVISGTARDIRERLLIAANQVRDIAEKQQGGGG